MFYTIMEDAEMEIQYSRVPRFLAKKHNWPTWAVARASYHKKDGTSVVMYFTHEDHVKDLIDALGRGEGECQGHLDVEELIM